jgi:L-glutamine-phosphate cytidylyltransferase
MKTRAVILAAGRGSRMGTATAHNHKCLTSIMGKPLLEWQIEAFHKAGINNITIVRGYKANLIKGDFKTIDNQRWDQTNMASSLFCVPEFEGRTIIAYSDIVYKSQYVTLLAKSKADICVLADLAWQDLWEKRFDNPLIDAETFRAKDGQLLEIGRKTNNINEIQAQYLGLLATSCTGWHRMLQKFLSLSTTEQDKKDMTGLLSDLTKDNNSISVIYINGGWCEIDTINDLLVYEQELNTNPAWLHDWRN